MKNYKGNELIYEQGVRLINKIPAGFHEEVDINEDDYSGIEAAVRAAENSDIVIMVLGEYGFQSGEGRSRAHIDLPGLQKDLLEAVYEVNKNIVLVLMNGRPLILNWADEHIPAILESWHLGSQSGHAIAQVLYGDYNPSGKLPMSFPRSEGQLPIYYNQKSTGRPGANGGDNGSVFWSHYGDEKNSPLYPFGFGLSYTTFSYSDIQLSNDIMNDGEDIIASVIVKNTGNKTGKEVVQLYLKDHYASAVRPTRELKGFELVELKPGESKKIEFKINRQLLSFYNALGVWEAEKGDFTVFIGTDSNTKRKASFVLN